MTAPHLSDRALLELAAKAEGHAVEFDEGSGFAFFDSKFSGILWNPLHNDGDAQRLAVKLQIEFKFSADHGGMVLARQSESLRSRFRKQPGVVIVHYVPEQMFSSNYQPDVTHAEYLVNIMLQVRGIEAATRRAIVRAAAEIGKEML